MSGAKPYFITYAEKQIEGITEDSAARDYVEGLNDALWLLQDEPKLATDLAEHENLHRYLNEIKLSIGMDEELYEFDDTQKKGEN